MAARRNARPFDPSALRRYAAPAIRAQLGPETLVRRYTLLVPLEEVKPGKPSRYIATDDDLGHLQMMLVEDFGGVTAAAVSPSLIGAGARDPRRPKFSLEVNKHAFFAVYAAAVRASEDNIDHTASPMKQRIHMDVHLRAQGAYGHTEFCKFLGSFMVDGNGKKSPAPSKPSPTVNSK